MSVLCRITSGRTPRIASRNSRLVSRSARLEPRRDPRPELHQIAVVERAARLDAEPANQPQPREVETRGGGVVGVEVGGKPVVGTVVPRVGVEYGPERIAVANEGGRFRRQEAADRRGPSERTPAERSELSREAVCGKDPLELDAQVALLRAVAQTVGGPSQPERHRSRDRQSIPEREKPLRGVDRVTPPQLVTAVPGQHVIHSVSRGLAQQPRRGHDPDVAEGDVHLADRLLLPHRIALPEHHLGVLRAQLLGEGTGVVRLVERGSGEPDPRCGATRPRSSQDARHGARIHTARKEDPHGSLPFPSRHCPREKLAETLADGGRVGRHRAREREAIPAPPGDDPSAGLGGDEAARGDPHDPIVERGLPRRVAPRQELDESLRADATDLSGGAPPAKAAVLIVEDNAAARRAARGYLEAWGCTVADAAEAQAALAALRSAAAEGRPVAVALIDQRMSGMDGWQLAGEIRRDPELSATRLVLISPAGMGAVEAKMRLLGWFSAYLTKPLKPRELAAALVRGPAPEEVEELAPEPDEPQAEAQAGEAAVENAGPAADAVRVLIAEDHAVNREMFRVVLRRCGCEVVATEDGEKALQAAGAGRFDIIFLDLQMPNLPGLEATRRLRGIGVQAPIVGMSASVLSQEREQCRAAGMNGFLAKPFGLKEVQEALARYLPARRAARTAAAAAKAADPAADDRPADRVFDAAEALAACLGDREALAGLLETFLRRLEEQLAVIRAALKEGGPAAKSAWQAARSAAVRAEAHSIKGAALNLCAGELAEEAAALEQLAAAGRRQEAADMFPQLEAAARRFHVRTQRRGHAPT